VSLASREFLLAPPDLTRWRAGNTGVEGVWRFRAAQAGPRVAVTALIHGNELCGAWAVAGLLERLHGGAQLQRGELTLALCNLAAFDRFDAAQPDSSRFVDEDLNRQWSAERLADGATAERRRAAELLPWLRDADFLLDLHSMHAPGAPLLLSGPLARHAAFARALGLAGHVVCDAGHADGTRLRDFGRWGDPADTACALLIECGWHGDPQSRRVAEDAVLRLLQHTDLIAAAQLPAAWRVAAPPARWMLDVGQAVVARSMDFRFAASFADLECIPRRGTVIAYDGGEAIVTPHDDCVLVMPSLSQLRPGVTVVRLARRRPLSP
jgi:predicted deacylase